MAITADSATNRRYVSSMGEWTRGRAGWLVGMIAVAVVGVGVAIAVGDMEVKAVGAFFAVLGLVGSTITLIRWDS
jgi:hypothetical protein